MDAPAPMNPREDEIDLGKYLAILRKEWWKIALFSLVVGAITMVVMLRSPNIYTSTTIITPAGDEGKQNPALGSLASFGISVGGPSKVEDLDTLFKSNDLTVRVFRKYNPWSYILAGNSDPVTGSPRSSWTNGLTGKGKEPKPPGDWDAIRGAKARMKVSTNKRAGTLSLSFDSTSAEGSAAMLKYYLEEGKNRLQEEALERSARNKKFIQEQISRTVDALTRDRLYTLYGQEVEREMLAHNREQFGFRVIDSPRVPDQKSRPSRSRTIVTMTTLSFIVACLFFAYRGRNRNLPPGQIAGNP
ncbi:Wzz/FepE/Etk N-terminal domain-containing protein [Candidatus Deferrimicrobium sp.]|uniref:Wzz/FepE/Etk N-terminal domain-containing protein n=1 Tax=Candidatus Deferrimicrobium sp. TaxID=3060586 RepID=UPI0027187FE7|nr:Wzz/FepE/Etk N-terminal domain-containing protein [Candidatus Deferrimicrobium sp.]MDO8739482.1 Wzz/FepE/Etk N-terminal domain-containing protein [Candidatus Deferrimicrobium sp.]